MKATTTAFAVMGLCTALLASCNKKNDDMMPSTYAPAQQNRDANMRSGDIRFTMGAAQVTGMSVMYNNRLLMDMNKPQEISWFTPMEKMGLAIPHGNYGNLITTIDMLPTPDAPGLWLSGEATIAPDVSEAPLLAPVDFMVTEPLHAKLNSGMIDVSASTTMINLLNLRLDALTANMPTDLWKAAYEASPKRIIVSETSNPELYRMMLENLRLILQGGTGGGGTEGPQYNAAVQQEGATY